MALDEHDREDLLRDGTAMNARGEIELELTAVTVGFRKEGQASFYFGPEVVFQFNASSELRRVFWYGRRLAARNASLAELIRPDRGGKVSFDTLDVDAATRDTLMRNFEAWLLRINQTLGDSSKWRTEGQDATTFCLRLLSWSKNLPRPIRVAQNPNA